MQSWDSVEPPIKESVPKMAHEDIEYERSGTSYSLALFWPVFLSNVHP